VPPLRERPEDIPLLAELFRAEVSGDHGGKFPTSDLVGLIARTWPGNVRELRNWVERHVLAGSEGSTVTTEVATFGEAKAEAVATFERAFLSQLMLRANGNVAEAARLAKMDRVHLSRLLRRHGIGR
jgi:transcriptional regulator with GAF, ATPase, and Fis domain